MADAKMKQKQKPPRQKPADRIFLRGLRLSCFIGVDAAEQHVRQAVVMDAEITPLAGDNAADGAFVPAVDYAVLARRLREWAEQNHHHYVEDLAAAAADLIIKEFAAAEVRIHCAKIRPLAGLDQFGAEVVRTKE
ncbi:MAG: dihydroneopterin aldolase [Gammaproteobacteria bacterium]